MQSHSDRHSMGTIWRGDPVPITVPTNDVYKNHTAPTSTRSVNPYNARITHPKQKQIGNATSRGIIAPSESSTAGRLAKRRKVDADQPLSARSGGNRESPVIVDNEDDDELNILPSHNKQYFVVQDGDSVKDIASIYSSDPIEQFPETNHDKGYVSERVHQYENKIPKLDLREMRVNGKSKPNVFPFLAKPNVLTMKPLRSEDTSYTLPVQSFYFNARLWSSEPDQQLWMCIRNRRLIFMVDSKEVNEQFVDGSYTMIYSSVIGLIPPFVMQLHSAKGGKGTTTICLDTKHRQWRDLTYFKFLETLKKNDVKYETMPSRQTVRLWEGAKQNAQVQDNETNELEEKELQSKPKQANIEPRLRQATTTSTALKRKADDLDFQAASPRLRFEAGSSRSKSTFVSTRHLRSANKVAHDVEPIPSAPANPDEVVLSYPAGLPGAVNITNLDLERLNPGAFLNDSLIEFGLKVWLKDLEISNPELADQIHVFSSFFYKKVNSKKDAQVAYESVRKWTNKFDIFRKRYIIVPINEHLHWYLAIIYEPEHVLTDPPVNTPPRPQTRLSTAQAISEHDSFSSRIGERQDSLDIEDLDRHSEVEVERHLEAFQSSCTIDDRGPRTTSPQPDGDIYEPLSPSADVIMASPKHRMSPVHSDHDSSTYQHHLPSAAAITTQGKRSLPVDPVSFYRPATRQYGKNKKVPNATKSPGVNVDPNERDEVQIIDCAPKTYIFTFDSLGTRHPQAVKKLSAYLRMEAKHKKGIDAPGIIEGKQALLPIQTNYCDCGIYLLHFARTFMKDPRKYANIILAPRTKPTGEIERKATWLVDQDFEPKGRQKLRLCIEDLSRDWKKLRDGPQKQPEEITKKDESEGEVELVESDTGKHEKSSRKTHGQKTGPASRVRG